MIAEFLFAFIFLFWIVFGSTREEAVKQRRAFARIPQQKE